MEGVGARSGRSRHGTVQTAFNGPVRKWMKKWVHVAPSKYHNNNNNNNNNNHSNINININGNISNNGNLGTGSNNNGPSNLLFYKWAPIANGVIIVNNNNGNNKDEEDDHENDVVEPAPKRKFRYVPVAFLEEQQNEAAENEAEKKGEDEVKLNDANSDAVEPTSKNEVLDEKPDINDVPMEENQDTDEAPSTRQDLNKNLSFNLNSNDDDPESDTNADEH